MKTSKKLRPLVLLIIILTAISCSDDISDCELTNSGTIQVENMRNNGVLQVHFNKGKIPVNGIGDLTVKPGEQANIQLPAGVHNVKTNLVITDCSGNRCSVSTTRLDEKDVDLSACATSNLIY
jgi:hypothetical protein